MPVTVSQAPASPSYVEVTELLGNELADLHFHVLCGEEHLDRRITHPRVQKPGLAFAGYYDYIKTGRVQIVGESETEYLKTVELTLRRERFTHVVDDKVPVFILSKGLEPFDTFLQLARERNIPVLSTSAFTSITIKRVSFFLEDHLVPVTRLHGGLMEIYGLGVLLIGRSGVGKSECALDLITRGHSLVADDIVTVRRYPAGDLVGYAEAPTKHHMELRGLGIVNVRDLFGLAAIRDRKNIDLVVELEPWAEGKAYDRLGLDESVYTILETPVPYIRMPVASGRNIASLVEIAARNHVLKLQGHNSARSLVQQLEARDARRRG
ncbi:MAG: HPr(Ser) kinase/phosphatase [Acidobacteriota bacterium]